LDIKLKSKNKKIGVLVLSLVLVPFLLGLILSFLRASEQRLDVIGNELNSNYNLINELMIYSNGFNEDIKESAIDGEIYNIKSVNNDMVQKSKDYLSLLKGNSAPSEEIAIAEESYNNAIKISARSDIEYREEATNNVKTRVRDLIGEIKRNVNIEFYFETDNPQMPITNVENKSKEEFEKKTLNNNKDYIILKSNSLIYSKSMEGVLGRAMNSFEDHDIYIRIASPLKFGDNIYNEVIKYDKNREGLYIPIVALAVDLIAMVFMMVTLIKSRELPLEEGQLGRIYKNLFSEVRILSYVLFIILILSLYSTTMCYGIYPLNIGKIVILLAVTLLMGYLCTIEGLRLIYLSKTGKLKEEIGKKSAIKILYSLVHDSFIIKTTGVKMVVIVLLLIFYIILRWIITGPIGAYFLGYYNRVFVLVDIIVAVVIISYVVSIVRDINQIKLATDNIVKGNYKNDIEIKNCQVLKGIADNLINIELGLEVAVEKAVKSEKMKGELITNVSHDLRNPLTSIINYVDLLGKEDVSKEDREKYIQVLKEKSQRLKSLIEDLFEASKAASGAMEINMENIEPVALLRQTIGEFEDKIEASGLQFIKKVPEGKVIAYADGVKTFRVFQNLISNILKYSMDNSRVYIEVIEEEEFIDITFRNISKYELSFSEEEILERFKRGDSSRTTEGSGLGLSIAKSLVEIQGGNFRIEIDGDLFKVIVKLKKGTLSEKLQVPIAEN